jgi:predicted aldo/keto reductase-like oxidoreductase
MDVAIMTPERIHHAISKMISSGIPYIEAVCAYAETNSIDIEVIAEVIKRSTVLKEKIRCEAVKLRMVKGNDDIDITQLY